VSSRPQSPLSKMVDNSVVMKRILYVASLCIGYAVGLLVANRPRFWWQDLFHNTALYWIGPALGAAVWLVRHMWCTRRWSWFSAIACFAYVFAAGRMIHRIWPYVSFPGWGEKSQISSISVSGAWIDSWTEQDDPIDVRRALGRYEPKIVVVSGRAVETLSNTMPLHEYPHRLKLHAEDSREIQLLSQMPFGEHSHKNLGINAEVGGLISVVVSPTKTIQFGVLDLPVAKTAADFERKRISSRRLSSLVRNSAETRIIVGQFHATPFSELVSIYTKQAKVRSLRFNSDGSAALRVLANYQAECPAQVFVSKDAVPESFEEFPIAGRRPPGVYFRIGLGK
jgi:hypothetical protein